MLQDAECQLTASPPDEDEESEEVRTRGYVVRFPLKGAFHITVSGGTRGHEDDGRDHDDQRPGTTTTNDDVDDDDTAAEDEDQFFFDDVAGTECDDDEDDDDDTDTDTDAHSDTADGMRQRWLPLPLPFKRTPPIPIVSPAASAPSCRSVSYQLPACNDLHGVGPEHDAVGGNARSPRAQSESSSRLYW